MSLPSMKICTTTTTTILKLPIIFERMPIQKGLKWSKMGQNYIKWFKMFLPPIKNESYLSKWRAWQVLAKALSLHVNYLDRTCLFKSTQRMTLCWHTTCLTSKSNAAVMRTCIGLYETHRSKSIGVSAHGSSPYSVLISLILCNGIPIAT